MSKVKIFVSYAHADFKPYAHYKESRVSCILDGIFDGLRCHDTRGPFAILMDRKGLILPTYVIDEKIDQAISECDIGLVLLSRSYCDSEECRAEFRKLLEQGKPLSIIETENAWSDQFEGEMRSIRKDVARIYREPFYGGSPGNFKPYGYPLPRLRPPEELHDYHDAVFRVVQGIETKAQEIRVGRRTAQGLPAEEVSAHRVFLADPTADVRDEAKSLAAALVKAGHSTLCFNTRLHVTPGQAVADAIKSAIAKCDIVFQVLGHIPGGQVDGRPLAQLQYEIASVSGKPFQVWSPVLDPDDCRPDYAAFLKSVHYHQNSYEEFEQYALKQADEIVRAAKARERRQDIPADAPPYVAIDVAKPDLPVAKLLIEAMERRAYVSPLSFDIDRAELADAVRDNDGIVMVFADSREGQKRINAHFPTILKVKHRNGLLDIAIGDGVGPEQNAGVPPYPHGPSVHVIRVDREHNRVDPKMLDEFFEVVRANAARRID